MFYTNFPTIATTITTKISEYHVIQLRGLRGSRKVHIAACHAQNLSARLLLATAGH